MKHIHNTKCRLVHFKSGIIVAISFRPFSFLPVSEIVNYMKHTQQAYPHTINANGRA